MNHAISAMCGGEKCACGEPATHKFSEEVFDDDPNPIRHPLTAYVCCDHFRLIVGGTCTGETTFDKLLAEGRQLLEAATSGPWHADCHGSIADPWYSVNRLGGASQVARFMSSEPHDAALVAWARNNLGRLLDEIRRLRAKTS